MKSLLASAVLVLSAVSAFATGIAFTGTSVTDASGKSAAAIAFGPSGSALTIFGRPHSQLDGTWTKVWSLDDCYYTSPDDDMLVFFPDGTGCLMIAVPGGFPVFVPFTWHL